MNGADCYVSLHRAEGFGYTLAEAMWIGKPVIATGYSGNVDYMSPTTATWSTIAWSRSGRVTTRIPPRVCGPSPTSSMPPG